MAILKDVSLAAIVRDEIMNPAGGVERWLRSTLPYVEEAVVVDTGSIDGTREKLEELQGEFDNLRAYDIKWEGFAKSRNFSLSKVNTKRVLVLDADEIISDRKKSISGGYRKLARFIELNPAIVYRLDSDWIYPDSNETYSYTFYSRLFLKLNSISFVGKKYDEFKRDGPFSRALVEPKDIPKVIGVNSGVKIKQFCSSLEAVKLKEKEFYEGDFGCKIPLPKLPNFHKWKAYNLKRDEYN